MLHLLMLPILLAAHAGQWIDSHVLSPFQLGETAKQVVEEEIGVFGVLAYLVYKTSRLLIEAWPLFEPAWLVRRVARAVALAAALIISAWLLTCIYIGTLIPILDLEVSCTGLLLAPCVAWVALGYVMLTERVRTRRAELESQAGDED